MTGGTFSKGVEKKQEVLGILEALEQESVNLRLLDSSQIPNIVLALDAKARVAWAVSGLKDHHWQDVASRARSISDKWHTLATKALDKANAVLSNPGDASTSGTFP
eukprot:202371-Pelagomonas_calceolata.AAC.1